MRRLLFLFIFSISVSSYGQFVDDFNRSQAKRDKARQGSPFGKNRRDAIWSHSQSQHRGFGWFINPGVTYMLGNSADDQDRPYNLTPTGLPGYYLEVGMEHLFKKPQKIVHY